MNTPRRELGTVKDWAKERLRTGAEPPWTYYRLMQLIEAVDLLSAGDDAVSPTENLPQLELQQDEIPPQEGNICRLDTARSRRDQQSVPLPT